MLVAAWLRFFQAFPADTVGYYVLVLDPPPTIDLIRKRDFVDELPLEIHDLFAFSADEVMVSHLCYLETGLTLDRLDLVDQSLACKGGQGPVDGVQGDRRNFCAQALVQGLGTGVVGRQGQLAIDFKPLVGESEAGFPAGEFKGADSFFDRFLCVEHGELPVSS